MYGSKEAARIYSSCLNPAILSQGCSLLHPPLLCVTESAVMATDEWERLRPTIVNLYLIEGLPLRKVASHMEEHYGFSKTKSQYEYKLNKWHVKKNSSKEIWHYICYHMSTRRDKDTIVFLHGVPLPENKLRKEVARNAPLPSLCGSSEMSRRPLTPEGLMISIRTPSALSLASPWPDNLPWFHFKRTVLPSLQFPAKILETYFTLRGASGVFQQQASNTTTHLGATSWHTPDPQKLKQTIKYFTRAIPKDAADIERQNASYVSADVPAWMATELLNIVFFRLSNNMDAYLSRHEMDTHDEALICLVKAVSLSNPKVISTLFIDRSATTNAIKEHVYGSAIRQRDYDMVSRLLACGVDPDQVLKGSYCDVCSQLTLRRGCLCLIRHFPWKNLSGLQFAALECDMQLGKILLEARANPNHWHESYGPPLSMIALALDNPDECEDAVRFARLLVHYGAIINLKLASCPCKKGTPFTPLAYAIAIGNSELVECLIEKGANTNPFEDDLLEPCCCCYSRFEFSVIAPFFVEDIRVTPLYFAIMSSKTVLTTRLIELVLEQPLHTISHLVPEILTFCCLAGDSSTALRLLDTGVDVNKAYRGVAPLSVTAWNADLTIANRLIRLGAHVSPSSSASSTVPSPIHVAAYHGNIKLVQRFIDEGVDCNAHYDRCPPASERSGHLLFDWLRGLSSATPLECAMTRRHIDTVKLLLPYSTLVGGELARALKIGDDSIIDEIIKRGATINGRDLGCILRDREEASAMSLIPRYIDSDGCYESLLLLPTYKAAKKLRDNTLIEKLVATRQKGAMDGHEAMAFDFAMEVNDPDLMDILLCDPFLRDPLASRDGSHHSPLCAALSRGNTATITKLTQQGYSLNEHDILVSIHTITSASGLIITAVLPKVWSQLRQSHTSPHQRQVLLLFAIIHQFTAGVRESSDLVISLEFGLLGEEHLVSDWNQCHFTPLSLAAEVGNKEILGLLLGSGADINWQRSCGCTTLARAAQLGLTKIVEFLLEQNAQVNAPSPLRHGATALQFAARNGNLTMALALISRGADVNALPSQYRERTALESAAENGRLDMVHLLLANGAQVSGKMRIYYVRAIGFARRMGHHALAEYIVQYGGWSEYDAALSNYPRILYGDTYFIYNDNRNVWHARHAKPTCQASSNGWLCDIPLTALLSDEENNSINRCVSGEAVIDESLSEEYPVAKEEISESEPQTCLTNCKSSLAIRHHETGTTTQPELINDSYALTSFVNFDPVDNGVVDYGLMSLEPPAENNLDFQPSAMTYDDDISRPNESSDDLRSNHESWTCKYNIATRIENLGDEPLGFLPLTNRTSPEPDEGPCADETFNMVTASTEFGAMKTRASVADTIMEDVLDDHGADQLPEEPVMQLTEPDDAHTAQHHPLIHMPEIGSTTAQLEGPRSAQMNWEDPYWGAATPDVYDI
ncbi:ankyrin repeat-containing domain protein [Xylariaceae sp. FL1019]|nr:ankyrin repeat-containing domain protein [Xylariaceae sp. FL1019]